MGYPSGMRAVYVLILTLVVGGCSGMGKEMDVTRDWPVKRLYEAAKDSLQSGDYETAVDYYEKLQSRFPFGAYAQQGQMELVYAYYKYDEPASAVAAADRFVKLYPRHPNVDDVLYIKGLTRFNQGKGLMEKLIPRDESQRDPGAALQAFNDFTELVEKYPESKYTKDARQRMIYLRNILARHEVHVADYYMRRGAYVAAVNRARFVVENYQRTPAVGDALAVMSMAYKVLGLNDLSADALRVLRLNYPEHPGIQDVETLQLEN